MYGRRPACRAGQRPAKQNAAGTAALQMGRGGTFSEKPPSKLIGEDIHAHYVSFIRICQFIAACADRSVCVYPRLSLCEPPARILVAGVSAWVKINLHRKRTGWKSGLNSPKNFTAHWTSIKHRESHSM